MQILTVLQRQGRTGWCIRAGLPLLVLFAHSSLLHCNHDVIFPDLQKAKLNPAAQEERLTQEIDDTRCTYYVFKCKGRDFTESWASSCKGNRLACSSGEF